MQVLPRNTPFVDFRIQVLGILLYCAISSGSPAPDIPSRSPEPSVFSAQKQPKGPGSADIGFRRRSSDFDKDASATGKVRKSAFSCTGRRPGHYGDSKFDCTVYHECDNRGGKRTFTCPEGTRFDQLKKICDYKARAECGEELVDLAFAGSQHTRSSTLISDPPRTRRRNGGKKQAEPVKTDVKVLEAVRLMGRLTPSKPSSGVVYSSPSTTEKTINRPVNEPRAASPASSSEKKLRSDDYVPAADRRSFYVPPQARSPAVYSHGLSQRGRAPGGFGDEIDFPEDFYDEFVPKRETDVPNVQEFVEPHNYLGEGPPAEKQWPPSRRPHKNNKHNRNNVNQEERDTRKPSKRVPETSPAPVYPRGFQPSQTPFRPIPRPAGANVEEERPTTGAPQKMQAKFTLSDARGSPSPLLDEPENNYQSLYDEQSINDDQDFHPVIKPGASQGYQVPERNPTAVRPFKRLKVTRPIKIQPMRKNNNNLGDWTPEFSSEPPQKVDLVEASKEDSPEDVPDFFEPEKPRRHHGRRRPHGGGRHKPGRKHGGMMDAPPRGEYKQEAFPSLDSDEVDQNVDAGPSSSPRSVGASSSKSGPYESQRIRQRVRHRERPEGGAGPVRRRNSNKGNKNKRLRPKPALEWLPNSEENTKQADLILDSEEFPEPDFPEPDLEKPRDKQNAVTPSLPAFEFNFGFKSPELEGDEFAFDENDDDEPPPVAPQRKRPHKNKQHKFHHGLESPPPVFERPLNTISEIPEVNPVAPHLPNLVPDIEYVAFLPPPPPKKESISHVYENQGVHSQVAYAEKDKSSFGPSHRPPVAPKHKVSNQQNPSNTFGDEDDRSPLRPMNPNHISNPQPVENPQWLEEERPVYTEPTQPQKPSKPTFVESRPEKFEPQGLSISKQRVRSRLPSGNRNEFKESLESLNQPKIPTITTAPVLHATTTPEPTSQPATQKTSTEGTTTPRPSRMSAYERYKNLREKYLAKFKSREKDGKTESDSDENDDEVSSQEIAAEAEEKSEPQQQQHQDSREEINNPTRSPVVQTETEEPDSPKPTALRGRFQPSRGSLRNTWKPSTPPSVRTTAEPTPAPVYDGQKPSRRPISARERLQGMYRRRPGLSTGTEKPEEEPQSKQQEPETVAEPEPSQEVQEVKIESIDIGGPLESGALESPTMNNNEEEDVKERSGPSEPSYDDSEDDEDEENSSPPPPNSAGGGEVRFSAPQPTTTTASIPGSADAAEFESSTADESPSEDEVKEGDDSEEHAEHSSKDEPKEEPAAAMGPDGPSRIAPTPTLPFPSFASQEPVLPLQSLFSVDFNRK